jgi:hypothetical protein
MESVSVKSSEQTQRKTSCLILLNNTGLASSDAQHSVSGLPLGRVCASVTVLLQGTRNKEVGVQCNVGHFLNTCRKFGDAHTTYFKIFG